MTEKQTLADILPDFTKDPESAGAENLVRGGAHVTTHNIMADGTLVSTPVPVEILSEDLIDMPAGQYSGDDLNAVQRIVAERQRQQRVEGFDLAHDDEHTNGELAGAAACYAAGALLANAQGLQAWPWWDGNGHPQWFKLTGDRERDLEKAGALILAELERLIRARKAAHKKAAAAYQGCQGTHLSNCGDQCNGSCTKKVEA